MLSWMIHYYYYATPGDRGLLSPREGCRPQCAKKKNLGCMGRKIFQNFKEMEELTDESVLKLKSNKLKRPTLNKDQEKFIQFLKQLLFFIFFLLPIF